ncbi:MAG: GDSL-type esterase/lipase family protein [Bacteroidota bacterium]|nr:GDSL-type esterase/lipase family protein [Bacteroidota bacterium]
MNKKITLSRILTLVLIGCILFAVNASAQTLDSSSYKQFTFIKNEMNRIENDSLSMAFFYEKLYQLQQSKSGRVNIVHIGDSHIQADNLSGQVRQKIQLRFGNAGRGLIFPYRAAKSNEPSSYKSTTNVVWEYKRNVFLEKPLPIGICGYTIETRDSAAELNITLKNQPGLDYSTSRFTLFHEKNLLSFDLKVNDAFNCVVGTIKPTDKSTNPFTSELKLEKPGSQFIIRNKCSDTVQKSTRIYGMLLENDSAGVLYNMIGVNGAEYRHYSASKYFMQQLSYLNPDLIIISLGTNEAYSAGFDKNTFEKNIDSLVTGLQLVHPNASILLMSPPDSYRRGKKGKVKNPDMKEARQVIVDYSIKKALPYWDLYEVMGGFGSMAKWYTMKLSAKDRVHFSGKGYQIQGDLFYNALIKGYENYVIKNKTSEKGR